MSTTTPPGRRETRDGVEQIVFTRAFAAPLGDVWAACTEPERLERWIGTWAGDPGCGEVAFQMAAEGDDVPEKVYLVQACEPPRCFVVRSRNAASFGADGTGPRVTWQYTPELSEADGVTTLPSRMNSQVGCRLGVLRLPGREAAASVTAAVGDPAQMW